MFCTFDRNWTGRSGNFSALKATKNEPFSCHGQWTMDNDVQTGGRQAVPGQWAEIGMQVAHAWPGGTHMLPAPSLPACHWNIWTENIYFLTRRFLCGGQAWPTHGPPVAYPWSTCGSPADHPVLVEMSRLGRKKFRATWMPDRPDIIPSFA